MQKMPPFFESILEVLRGHVETRGDNNAFTFLESDEERISITYQQLDDRARFIASGLLKNAEPGDRALMMYPAGLEFIEAFMGCLYAGIVAVPAYPPKRNRSAERIRSIAKDCMPRLLLCTSDTQRSVEEEFSESGDGSLVIVTDELESSPESSFPEIHCDQPAFLQYTSGSTAMPKGVCISHRNLIANEIAIKQAFGHDEYSVFCSWLPVFHDMGLIGKVLQPLFVGCPSILMSPNRFLSKPVRWFQAIDEYKVTSTGGPNFCYEHCLRLVDDRETEGLDLTSWRVAFNGAEPVRKSTLDRFALKFSRIGFSKSSFFPCYGMAESTLLVSGGRQSREPKASLIPNHEGHFGASANGQYHVVSCGEVASALDLKIVHPDSLRPLDDLNIGEIWVRGGSVAEGYWNQLPVPLDFAARYDGQIDAIPYFRSGDLGFLDSTELYVTGRLKDLIIVNGRNIHPHDIEQIAEEKLGGLAANSAAAFSILINGEEKLCVVMQASRTLARYARNDDLGECEAETLKSLLANIRQDVAAKHNVRVEYFGFLSVGEFPRTSSGKVQRRACKSALQNGALNFLKLPGCVSSSWLAFLAPKNHQT
jgi:acyl-CoA synthetase (AMP-forming)/AMP-acid ligase II